MKTTMMSLILTVFILLAIHDKVKVIAGSGNFITKVVERFHKNCCKDIRCIPPDRCFLSLRSGTQLFCECFSASLFNDD